MTGYDSMVTKDSDNKEMVTWCYTTFHGGFFVSCIREEADPELGASMAQAGFVETTGLSVEDVAASEEWYEVSAELIPPPRLRFMDDEPLDPGEVIEAADQLAGPNPPGYEEFLQTEGWEKAGE